MSGEPCVRRVVAGSLFSSAGIVCNPVEMVCLLLRLRIITAVHVSYIKMFTRDNVEHSSVVRAQQQGNCS